MKGKEPIDFSRYRYGLTPDERALLRRIIVAGRDVLDCAQWCRYNANWIKRDMALGKRIA